SDVCSSDLLTISCEGVPPNCKRKQERRDVTSAVARVCGKDRMDPAACLGYWRGGLASPGADFGSGGIISRLGGVTTLSPSKEGLHRVATGQQEPSVPAKQIQF